ncbi:MULTISPECIES: alkyl sulfatase dimerization domain-containing protein [unclassified Pseudomonas]|uniref:alkyl/aryl-sulfatase n=1 Tax=unclassified Pseudomonas TaxID=196821 RepID=UPI002448126E|nr:MULTISPECIES: alkyl sulfatase dimerization domain-containing protein [unclassified Pseudomonas]MDG9924299.1 MBL fold metallo-hydrolase [Pseudomonas sp. GD04045]MDH0033340.1 MBL fold metallo-hydrolase [Pseudomonas sp. GD04019]
MRRSLQRLCAAGLTSALLASAIAQASPAPTQPASAATQLANQAVLNQLPFADKQDFENAQRGFIAKPETLTIKDANGKVVWDLESYKQYIAADKPAPDSVNPSLWRHAQLSMEYGLFRVTEGIYQVRGYDVSNITFVEGKTGWIVFDPLLSAETAKAAYELVSANLGQKPVVAVVYSHSHIDHFGGVRGIVDEADVKAGKVRIIAPKGFTEHAVSENVIAGNAMARRAVYQFGAMLPRNAQGGVNAGMGMTVSAGATTLIQPTEEVEKTGQELTVDGVQMVFQMTPGGEAPVEMHTYFPASKALWMAENTTNNMHNVLTPRGAQVRDALQWSKYIGEAIALYGDKSVVKFQSHHWPLWGQPQIVDYLKKQRALYKYIHDQSVRLMNQGLNAEEIAETIKLPPELESFWPGRGVYGTLKFNAKAIYQRYLGWYDANPANLDKLPPQPAAKKYVEYMGGSAAVLEKAKADFTKGEYRWVAEATKHVVFAEPDNAAAKNLLADSLEQLGYQAESGPWRSMYLQGAFELRNGLPQGGGTVTASPDVIRAMTPEMLFDYLAVRLNGERAAGKKLVLNYRFSDLGKDYALTVENGVLTYEPKLAANADVGLTMNKTTLEDIQLGKATLEQKVASGELKFDGRPQAFGEFMGLLDKFDFWFNIATP